MYDQVNNTDPRVKYSSGSEWSAIPINGSTLHSTSTVGAFFKIHFGRESLERSFDRTFLRNVAFYALVLMLAPLFFPASTFEGVISLVGRVNDTDKCDGKVALAYSVDNVPSTPVNVLESLSPLFHMSVRGTRHSLFVNLTEVDGDCSFLFDHASLDPTNTTNNTSSSKSYETMNMEVTLSLGTHSALSTPSPTIYATAPGSTVLSATSNAPHSHSLIGPVVGGVLGSFVLMVLVCAICIWYRRSRPLAPSTAYSRSIARDPGSEDPELGSQQTGVLVLVCEICVVVNSIVISKAFLPGVVTVPGEPEPQPCPTSRSLTSLATLTVDFRVLCP